ncbi:MULTISPECIES: ABC transporter permease [unclassified Haladaptatus]|uniref:ABC transporter permease n=1 Tax=unclassified Haladaptatus TaxID=2622732 RepID=UPI00209BF27D|nr:MULTISPECIES: ABC transporter permease [unclassified Haladaptatus]MCO8243094.1 ABC transporter permease [Haladaptatus sp. AB643]MCO8252808.1 ABC transporter permease [Haladaptatus sp. AB618]
MSMYRYTVRRILQIIPVLLGVFTLTFVMMHSLPGNPVKIYLGLNPSKELADQLIHQYGFDQPLWKQYLDYLSKVLHGNLGESFMLKRPVIDLMLERVGPTFTLMGLSYVIALPISILLGVYAASRHNELGDHVSRFVGLAGLSTPNFWLGLMLMFIVAVKLQWLPVSGYVPFAQAPVESAKRLVMPVITLSTAMTATLMRMTRSSMVEELSQDYVQTARAYGLPERRILLKHSFRNALLPLVTIIGLQLSFLLDGSVVTEKIFAIPGMGRLFFNGMTNNDYGVIMGMTLTFALLFLAGVLLTDLAYAYIDPRIRYD